MMYCSFERRNNPIDNPILFVRRYDKIRHLLAFHPIHLEHMYEQWVEFKKSEALKREKADTCIREW